VLLAAKIVRRNSIPLGRRMIGVVEGTPDRECVGNGPIASKVRSGEQSAGDQKMKVATTPDRASGKTGQSAGDRRRRSMPMVIQGSGSLG